MPKAQGGCLCGALRYEVSNQPVRVTMCHCKFCQRATGSAYLVEPIFDNGDFAMVKGNPKRYIHRSEGSGKEVYVHFCETCGTKLFLTFERFETAVGVYGGTFDDPDWLHITPDNSKHIFLSMAQKGTIIPPHIHSYQEHAMENDGTPIEPTIFNTAKVIGEDEQ